MESDDGASFDRPGTAWFCDWIAERVVAGRARRTYPWRASASARLVAGLALGTATRLWPHPSQLRRRRLRRAWLQHHAFPPRRAPGNRAGDARSGATGSVAVSIWSSYTARMRVGQMRIAISID